MDDKDNNIKAAVWCAKVLAFGQIGFLLLNLWTNYFLNFKGIIWVQRDNTQFQVFQSRTGHIFSEPHCEMEVSVAYQNASDFSNNWSEIVDNYFGVHLALTTAKYLILFFVWWKVAVLLKSAFEERIFSSNTIRTFWVIGFLLLSIPILDYFAKYTMTQYVSINAHLFPQLPVTPWTGLHYFPVEGTDMYIFYIPLFFMAFLEIFRHGLQLKSENDLTV